MKTKLFRRMKMVATAVKHIVVKRQRRIQAVQFTYNLKPFLLLGVKGDRVLARKILQNGTPSIRVTEFSRRMVEEAINAKLDDHDYALKVATPARR